MPEEMSHVQPQVHTGPEGLPSQAKPAFSAPALSGVSGCRSQDTSLLSEPCVIGMCTVTLTWWATRSSHSVIPAAELLLAGGDHASFLLPNRTASQE